MTDILLPPSTRRRAIPLRPVTAHGMRLFLSEASAEVKAWVKAHHFKAKAGGFLCLPDEKGSIREVLVGLDHKPDIWALAALPSALPYGLYRLECAEDVSVEQRTLMAIGWGLGCYSYQRFRTEVSMKEPVKFSSLILAEGTDMEEVRRVVDATFLVRDLVNAPANALGPSELAQVATELAKKHKAKIDVTVGKDLLKQNYPAIFEVGQACDDAPRLIDIRWGKASHPKITLVGKGVCFDSGGLDIKSASNMLLMKKDMGGAAHVLALAQMVMQAKLPVRLRVLVPAVENSIAGNAYRPMDVINTRAGMTVEVGNTDAEGRLVLCDALCEADGEKPELIIDCATLTGAARVALGAEMPAFFTPSEKLASRLEEAFRHQQDPLWRLPLYAPYDDQLKSAVADVSSTSSSGYGGAITAALFLKRFVAHTHDWVHLDMMAWNAGSRPGRPAGGEAMGLRALYALVKKYL